MKIKNMNLLFILTFFTLLSFSETARANDLNRGNQVTTETRAPKYLYKVVSPADWQKSQEQKVIQTSSIDDTFIHLAKEDQVPHIVQKFWNNKDYVVLKLDTKKLVGRLVYENNPGGTTLYYHLYEGKIPLDAVVDVSSE